MNADYFIWTEVFNCGKIGKIAIESYLMHHDTPVHVFGKKADLIVIPDSPLVIKIELPNSAYDDLRCFLWSTTGIGDPIITQNYLDNGFRKGHLGTARLWAYLIQARKERLLIHFDSDVIFIGNIVKEILDSSKDFDLIGPVRCYKNNPNNRNDVRHLPDVTQTCCFGFNREKISRHSYRDLVRMCLGTYNPLGHPVIDFFDPVMFEIIKAGGRIKFLKHDDVGGCNLEGSRINCFSEINDFETPYKIDFGSKLIHFSAVGSGMNIYHNKVSTVEGYRQYALDRYALFCEIFYNEDIGVDLSAYETLIKKLRKIDKSYKLSQD